MKKGIKYILFLLMMMIFVNMLFAIIQKYLPVSFVMPHSIIEPAKIFKFEIGKYSFTINQTIINTWALMILIMGIVIVGTRKLSIKNPTKLQIILEEYYQFIEKTFLIKVEHEKEKYVGFFAALFSIILFSNLSIFIFSFMVMIRKVDGVYEVSHFFRTPTADPNTTIALSLVVLVFSTILAIKKKGLKRYLKSYLEPMWFMLPLNIIEKISSVLNTSMRLFGNMLAGLVIVGLLYSLVSKNLISSITNNNLNGIFSFSVGWPMMLQLYLDLFVGIIQTYVFTILSATYVCEALEEHH